MESKTPTRGMNAYEKLEYYTRRDKNTECWIWAGPVNQYGYGRISVNKVVSFAHRVAWSKDNGAIPEGMFICHKCDTPPCVNPDHLFLGTPKDNTQDSINKGRKSHIGIKNGRAKLTESQVIMIMNDTRIHRVIAEDHKVSSSTVHHIKTGRRWTHVTNNKEKL